MTTKNSFESIETAGIIHRGHDGRVCIDDGSYDTEIDEWFLSLLIGSYVELTIRITDPPDEVMRGLQEEYRNG